MYYIKNKRDKIGNCNICRKVKPLTWDHVPPRGGIEVNNVEVETLYKIFKVNNKRQKIISQNGIKFRTICKNCNEKLGSSYDKIINKFSKDLGLFLKSNLIFPDIIHIKTKPAQLIRGLLAHSLSILIEYEETLFDEKIRDYVFDESKKLPEDVFIFYWVYPYPQTILARDIFIPKNDNEVGHYNLLKSFPIAYLIINLNEYYNLYELTTYREARINDEIELAVNLKQNYEFDWPEKLSHSQIILLGKSSMSSILSKTKK